MIDFLHWASLQPTTAGCSHRKLVRFATRRRRVVRSMHPLRSFTHTRGPRCCCCHSARARAHLRVSSPLLSPPSTPVTTRRSPSKSPAMGSEQVGSRRPASRRKVQTDSNSRTRVATGPAGPAGLLRGRRRHHERAESGEGARVRGGARPCAAEDSPCCLSAAAEPNCVWPTWMLCGRHSLPRCRLTINAPPPHRRLVGPFRSSSRSTAMTEANFSRFPESARMARPSAMMA